MGRNSVEVDYGSSGNSVVAVFGTPVEAEYALSSLKLSGVAAGDISVAVQDGVPTRGVGIDPGSNVTASAAIGALFGAIIVGFLAWAFSIGSIALPGQTPSSGIGALAATLTGAGLGAAIGGLLGGLLGFRVPTESDEEQEERARSASVLVTVSTPMYSDPSRVQDVLSASGGRNIQAYSAVPQSAIPQEDTVMDKQHDRVEPSYETAPGYAGELQDYGSVTSEGNYTQDSDNRQTALARSNSGDVPLGDPTLATVAADTEEEAVQGAKADVDESTGEPNWYEAMPGLPGLPVSRAPQIGIEETRKAEDAETWADLAAMEANHTMENTPLNENTEGKNANNVTGTQGAINPDTGTFGTAGTPMTTGYGVSGSTIGSGTAGTEDASNSGDFRGATPDSSSYEMGGRGSTDSRNSLQGAERDDSVVDKYAGQNLDEAAPQLRQDSRNRDIYEQGPSYGENQLAQTNSNRTDLYSDAGADTPPSYATGPAEETQESAGTNIPGSSDPRGRGDNTDDVD